MTLFSYMQAMDSSLLAPGAGFDATSTLRLRSTLQEALFEHLPSERIAELLLENSARAHLEVGSVLEKLIQGAGFAMLGRREKAQLVQEVVDLVLGLGPLEELLADPRVTEIMVNGATCVFYEQDGKIFQSQVCFRDDQQLRMIIDRIVGPLGRRVDEQSPIVSARLAAGHRVNVVIPPLSLDGPILTIRKFRDEVFTLPELIQMGSIDEHCATLLRWAVLSSQNIAVSGGTGSGKTTFLNALSVEIPASERIITIEDAAELRFSDHPHVVRLEARPKNAEGTGEISIRDLVINALRMRPDRIVVGECRGAEALDMLQAMNTGHDGSLTTLHANSPFEVSKRLVMMARYAMDIPVSIIEEQIASALDIVVQLDRFNDGKRRVTSICEFGAVGQRGPKVSQLCVWSLKDGRYHWKSLPSWLRHASGESNVRTDCGLSDTLCAPINREEVAEWVKSVGL
ncbi:MAG: CpaF family protein [Coriobacteriales bacterium]|jgi:pilus assembly protein CpaF|nr:CpaF family protein [Coriobacteriales bacterium]